MLTLPTLITVMERPLYASDPMAIDLMQTVYAFDATTMTCACWFIRGTVSRTQGCYQILRLILLDGVLHPLHYLHQRR
jgi:hypothetical protein